MRGRGDRARTARSDRAQLHPLRRLPTQAPTSLLHPRSPRPCPTHRPRRSGGNSDDPHSTPSLPRSRSRRSRSHRTHLRLLLLLPCPRPLRLLPFVAVASLGPSGHPEPVPQLAGGAGCIPRRRPPPSILPPRRKRRRGARANRVLRPSLAEASTARGAKAARDAQGPRHRLRPTAGPGRTTAPSPPTRPSPQGPRGRAPLCGRRLARAPTGSR